jgi:5-methylcytosine-specific restriction endonuclease McrA
VKRSGLKRSSPEQIGAWRARSKQLRPKNRLRQTRLPTSTAVGRRETRAAVFERDRYRCQLAGLPGAGHCFGGLTPHHRLKASQGGAYSLENLVTACAHHNGLLEADAGFAEAGIKAGLVVRSWQPEAETLREVR